MAHRPRAHRPGIDSKPSRQDHVCAECGYSSPKWFGRCPDCGAWSSATTTGGNEEDGLVVASLTDCGPAPDRLACGLEEVDRVLGGGLVMGEVVLLGGEPGAGKSTLVLQLLDGLHASARRSLLVSGEESAHQIALRAARLGVEVGALRVALGESLQATLSTCAREQPDVVVVDSIQTLVDTRLEQSPGSVVQVRECAAALVRYAKASGTAIVLIGHVTKDGSIAGPKTLEHIVDAVLALEGEREGSLRLLRASKNRFGSCDEVGVLTMSSSGLRGVADPSALLLADRRAGVEGSVVFPSLDGVRPLLVELQALAPETRAPQPRRVALGVEARRLALVCAVLSDKTNMSFAERDVFVSAAGGLVVKEPAADLALCFALASAVTGAPIDPGTVVIGEVGLSGEIRRAGGIDRRVDEAIRHGFDKVIVPPEVRVDRAGLAVEVVTDVRSALDLVLRSGTRAV